MEKNVTSVLCLLDYALNYEVRLKNCINVGSKWQENWFKSECKLAHLHWLLRGGYEFKGCHKLNQVIINSWNVFRCIITAKRNLKMWTM